MFIKNDDMSIYCTRGDCGEFPVPAVINGESTVFAPGDVLRFKMFKKKDCSAVVMQRDFTVETEADTFVISLTAEDTKIGEVISKPTDYWYEIELNPETHPQTIIGYDEDGPKVFKLFPEGKDIDAEDIEVVGPKTLKELIDYALEQMGDVNAENIVTIESLKDLSFDKTSVVLSALPNADGKPQFNATPDLVLTYNGSVPKETYSDKIMTWLKLVALPNDAVVDTKLAFKIDMFADDVKVNDSILASASVARDYRYEAEDGTLGGNVMISHSELASNGKQVASLDGHTSNLNNYVEITVNVPKAGNYQMAVCTKSTDAALNISINGGEAVATNFNNGDNVITKIPVELLEGDNVIKFSGIPNSSKWAMLDYICIEGLTQTELNLYALPRVDAAEALKNASSIRFDVYICDRTEGATGNTVLSFDTDNSRISINTDGRVQTEWEGKDFLYGHCERLDINGKPISGGAPRRYFVSSWATNAEDWEIPCYRTIYEQNGCLTTHTVDHPYSAVNVEYMGRELQNKVLIVNITYDEESGTYKSSETYDTILKRVKDGATVYALCDGYTYHLGYIDEYDAVFEYISDDNFFYRMFISIGGRVFRTEYDILTGESLSGIYEGVRENVENTISETISVYETTSIEVGTPIIHVSTINLISTFQKGVLKLCYIQESDIDSSFAYFMYDCTSVCYNSDAKAYDFHFNHLDGFNGEVRYIVARAEKDSLLTVIDTGASYLC